MKKKALLLLAVVAIAGIFVVVLNACSKTDSQTPNKEIFVYEEFIPAREDVIPLIKTFNTAYKNHKLGYKSGEDMPLNEAIWTLEAGVNYEFRWPKDSLIISMYDTAFFTANTSVNEIGQLIMSSDDLFEVYSELLYFNENALNETGQNFKLYFADVEINSYSENEIELIVTSGFGYPKPRVCFVNSEDYWYAANELGNCDIGEPLSGINDAADRINQLINNRNCSSLTCPGGGEVSSFHSITNISLIYDPITYQYYFWNGFSTDCLEPNNIAYWQGIAETLIEDHRPPGKTFMDVIYSDAIIQNTNFWLHLADQVRYGIPNCEGSGGEE